MASAEGIRIKDLIEVETEKLVKHLTGLGNSDDDLMNIETACEFADSNFRLHTFLHPNSHQLERTVEGLSEKFEVHSQDHKAEALRRLKVHLIRNVAPYRDGVDTAYSILSLLIQLSDSPIHVEYEEPPAELAEQRLLQDLPVEFLSGYTSGESWSEYESDDGTDWSLSDDDDFLVGARAPVQTDLSSAFIDPPLGPRLEKQVQANVADLKQRDPFAELRWKLVDPYFETATVATAVREVDAAVDYAAKIGVGTIWTHLAPGLHSDRSRAVDEENVVRETCWMLAGLECALYSQKTTISGGRQIQLKNGWRLHGTTTTGLSNAVSEFEEFGTMLVALRQFVAQAKQHPEEGGSTTSRTHQALAFSDEHLLHQLNLTLTTLEHTTSLRKLSIALHDQRVRIGALVALHQDSGVLSDSIEGSVAERVTRLLNTLYNAAFRTEIISESAPNMAECVLSLFVDTVTPLFNFLDRWIHSGVIDDPYDEFPVVEFHPGRIDPRLLPAWEQFSLRHDPTVNGAHRNSSTASPKEYSYCPDLIPMFLHPILQPILVGGKSSRMLRNAGFRSPILEPTLRKFLSTLRIRSDARQDSSSIVESNVTNTPAIRFSRETEAEQLLIDEVLEMVKPLPPAEKSDWAGTSTYSTTSAGTAAFVRHFHRAITNDYLNTSNSYLSVLNQQFHLLEHLTIMRQFFLFEAGSSVHPVCINIFSTIPALPEESWDRAAEYTDLFQKAMADSGHSRQRQRVLVTLPPRCPATPIEAVRALRLVYQLPVQVEFVIDRTAQHIYSESFSFLLQIKWAKWMLENVRTRRDFGWSSGGVDTHRVLILRSRILHAINAIQSYLLSRLLDHLSVDFKAGLAQAHDLDDVCRLHSEYVTSVREQCLLSRAAEKVRAAIVKIADTGVRFRRLWDGMTNRVVRRAHVGSEKFAALERDFRSCCEFVAVLLQSVVKNGAHAHLIPLLDALQTYRTLPAIWV